MKYCSHCGHPNQDGTLFCGACGKPLSPNMERNGVGSQSHHTTNRKAGGSWIDSLNEYVGNDRPADLNWQVLFSDVFKLHTTEEAEDFLSVEQRRRLLICVPYLKTGRTHGYIVECC